MFPDRRIVLGGLASALAAVGGEAAETAVEDAARRSVARPATIKRVFPAGPPAAILLYTLAPDLLLGWPRANRAEEREFLLPDVGGRPEIGRITGRSNSANLEAVLAAKPDLIIDVGSTGPTYVSLAERVQSQTGIPYALLDGTLARTAETYRTLGRLLGRERDAEEKATYAEALLAHIAQRVATVPADRRPRVYYARGPRGLETGRGGSINVESLDMLGAVNVAGGTGGGLATVSLEQVLAWDPEVIVTIDRDFAAFVRQDPAWASVRAVRDGRVHLSPKLPFGWVDFPPSVNRLIGLIWLGKLLYPALFPEDLVAETRAFYRLFYHVTPSDEGIARVLAGRG
ncbi:iron ABC transporter substrate-binding protein [Enterovirga aerilata]|uniref:Iron ABC transporter substrate-binding protein n=1 Tax=Enterovirga aerilata TaxID=2730920 RepID=A0A849I833_9HYPH|nr:iron ABC transporter substrate-binding protein [Enterovirga sp. DB1703]NNM72455.1 iron ABC transporter substrate-binding protein [Enterovirga sp. DB1703]